MACYYAIERSPEYLMHYGIRGMKWGVKKARERLDEKALARHYAKAAKKLKQLNENTNQELMKKRYQQAKRNMLAGGVSSATLSGIGTAAINSDLPALENLKYSLAAGGLAGLAGAALNSKGLGSFRYASDRGHRKAVFKRDEWKKEMREAFKGTKYGRKRKRKT